MHPTLKRRNGVRRSGPLSVGLAVALTATLTAACGSSKTTAASTATTAASSATTADSSATSPAGTVSSSVAAAEAVVAKYSKSPTTIGVTTPLNTVPPKGKTIVYVECEVTQCTDVGAGIQAAATAVGWHTQFIRWQSTQPATLVAGLQQALQVTPKPAAVVVTGLAPAVWDSVVPAYQKAGIPLIPAFVGPSTINSTLIANIFGPNDIALVGKILADWFIADSNGKGKVLLQDFPDIPSVSLGAQAFRKEVAAKCPACSINSLDVTLAQLATGATTPAIVSALQRYSQDTYFVSSDIGLVAGLPAALAAAGLSKVKVAGAAATVAEEQSLLNGTGSAFVASALHYSGWLIVDVALRHVEGMTFSPEDGGLPEKLLTKATVGTPGVNQDLPVNYQQQFKALWKVG